MDERREIEVSSLNIAELDVLELERRVELATAAEAGPWICGAYVEPVCPQLQCGIDGVQA